jgi:hypothetical protein
MFIMILKFPFCVLKTFSCGKNYIRWKPVWITLDYWMYNSMESRSTSAGHVVKQWSYTASTTWGIQNFAFFFMFITSASSVAGTRAPKGNTRVRETNNYQVLQYMLWTSKRYDSLVKIYFIVQKIHYTVWTRKWQFPFIALLTKLTHKALYSKCVSPEMQRQWLQVNEPFSN